MNASALLQDSIVQSLRHTLLEQARSGGPLYLRLSNSLREAVHNGVLPTGNGLPPERELAQALGVSRETLRRAVEQLTQEGLLTAHQGSGTYVSGRIVEPLSLLASFSEDMRRRGYTPGSVWLTRELATPSSEEALALGLSLRDQVVRAARVRTASGAPMAVERASVSASLVGGTCKFGDSLYAALQRHGAAPVRALQRVRANVADAESAGLLELAIGAPVLETERRSFTQEGRAIELTRSTYRGDSYDYVVEMRVSAPQRL